MKTDKLYIYLKKKTQNSDFEQIRNLFYSIFCTIDILPFDFQSIEITKEVLAIIFSKIVKEKLGIDHKFISLSNSNPATSQYWIELINKYLLMGESPNLLEAKNILLSTNSSVDQGQN